eukprot:6188314-Pleurochrysis_carterae.AAC.1
MQIAADKSWSCAGACTVRISTCPAHQLHVFACICADSTCSVCPCTSRCAESLHACVTSGCAGAVSACDARVCAALRARAPRARAMSARLLLRAGALVRASAAFTTPTRALSACTVRACVTMRAYA